MRKRPPFRAPRRRPRERGMALVLVLLATAILGLVAASAALSNIANIQAARNYRGVTQARYVAESGLTRAVQAINTVGVINYQTEVVGGWSNFLGTSPRPFAPLQGFTFTVTPLVRWSNPAEHGRLRAVATGASGETATVVATLVRQNFPLASPGAIYLANDDPTNSTFRGSTFEIDGNDTNLDGTVGPQGAKPGLSTRNAVNTQEAIASLNDGQKQHVLGLGYSPDPLTPSVMTAAYAPSIAQMNQMVNAMIAAGQASGEYVGYNNNLLNGNLSIGTLSDPKVVHFTNPGGIEIKANRANGTAGGVGIMIVDGDLTITGTFDWIGLIIVKGTTTIANTTTLSGTANIWGSLWTQDINLVVGGSAIAQYSSQGLTFANTIVPSGTLPSAMDVTAVVDCVQLPPNRGGCP